MKRTGQQRLDAIPAAIEAEEEFRNRIAAAEGDAHALAYLMADAIEAAQDARRIEPVGRDGRALVCFEEVASCRLLNEVGAAFRRATERKAAAA